jgi:hypothetical protein
MHLLHMGLDDAFFFLGEASVLVGELAFDDGRYDTETSRLFHLQRDEEAVNTPLKKRRNRFEMACNGVKYRLNTVKLPVVQRRGHHRDGIRRPGWCPPDETCTYRAAAASSLPRR